MPRAVPLVAFAVPLAVLLTLLAGFLIIVAQVSIYQEREHDDHASQAREGYRVALAALGNVKQKASVSLDACGALVEQGVTGLAAGLVGLDDATLLSNQNVSHALLSLSPLILTATSFFGVVLDSNVQVGERFGAKYVARGSSAIAFSFATAQSIQTVVSVSTLNRSITSPVSSSSVSLVGAPVSMANPTFPITTLSALAFARTFSSAGAPAGSYAFSTVPVLEIAASVVQGLRGTSGVVLIANDVVVFYREPDTGLPEEVPVVPSAQASSHDLCYPDTPGCTMSLSTWMSRIGEPKGWGKAREVFTATGEKEIDLSDPRHLVYGNTASQLLGDTVPTRLVIIVSHERQHTVALDDYIVGFVTVVIGAVLSGVIIAVLVTTLVSKPIRGLSQQFDFTASTLTVQSESTLNDAGGRVQVSELQLLTETVRDLWEFVADIRPRVPAYVLHKIDLLEEMAASDGVLIAPVVSAAEPTSSPTLSRGASTGSAPQGSASRLQTLLGVKSPTSEGSSDSKAQGGSGDLIDSKGVGEAFVTTLPPIDLAVPMRRRTSANNGNARTLANGAPPLPPKSNSPEMRSARANSPSADGGGSVWSLDFGSSNVGSGSSEPRVRPSREFTVSDDKEDSPQSPLRNPAEFSAVGSAGDTNSESHPQLVGSGPPPSVNPPGSSAMTSGTSAFQPPVGPSGITMSVTTEGNMWASGSRIGSRMGTNLRIMSNALPSGSSSNVESGTGTRRLNSSLAASSFNNSTSSVASSLTSAIRQLFGRATVMTIVFDDRVLNTVSSSETAKVFVAAVTANEGVIASISRSRYMATFNLSTPCDMHEQRACQTALEFVGTAESLGLGGFAVAIDTTDAFSVIVGPPDRRARISASIAMEFTRHLAPLGFLLHAPILVTERTARVVSIQAVIADCVELEPHWVVPMIGGGTVFDDLQGRVTVLQLLPMPRADMFAAESLPWYVDALEAMKEGNTEAAIAMWETALRPGGPATSPNLHARVMRMLESCQKRRTRERYAHRASLTWQTFYRLEGVAAVQGSNQQRQRGFGGPRSITSPAAAANASRSGVSFAAYGGGGGTGSPSASFGDPPLAFGGNSLTADGRSFTTDGRSSDRLRASGASYSGSFGTHSVGTSLANRNSFGRSGTLSTGGHSATSVADPPMGFGASIDSQSLNQMPHLHASVSVSQAPAMPESPPLGPLSMSRNGNSTSMSIENIHDPPLGFGTSLTDREHSGNSNSQSVSLEDRSADGQVVLPEGGSPPLMATLPDR